MSESRSVSPLSSEETEPEKARRAKKGAPPPGGPGLPRWPERLHARIDRIANTATNGAKGLVGVWALLLTVVVIRTAIERASTVSFEGPLDVPKALAERGFTGPVLLDHLNQKSKAILAHSKKRASPGGEALFLDGADSPVLADTQVPGTGMSLSQVVDLLLEVVGQSPQKVAGNVIARGDQLSLHLSVAGTKPAVLRAKAGDCGEGCLDELEPLIEQAGRHVVKKLHPIALVSYLTEVAPEEAEAAIRDCLANGSDDDDAAAYNFWGILLGRKGDTEGAKEKLEAALQLAKKSKLGKDIEAAIHNNKGVALARSGAMDEARKAYGDALAADPTHAQAHLNMGRSYHAEANYEEAVKEYKKATELDPKLSEAHFNQADALAHMGKKDEAMESLKKAEKLIPGNGEVARRIAGLKGAKGKGGG